MVLNLTVNVGPVKLVSGQSVTGGSCYIAGMDAFHHFWTK